MPVAAPRPCTYPGCVVMAAKGGRCMSHQPPPWAGKRPSARERYGSGWDKLRAQVMRRDQWLCQSCRIRSATDCDHITPKAQGGDDSMDNLQALCRACHKAKTLSERCKKETLGEGEG